MTCGNRLDDEAAYCGRCGARTGQPVLAAPNPAAPIPPFAPRSDPPHQPTRHSQTADFFSRFVAFVMDSIFSGLAPIIPGLVIAVALILLVGGAQGDPASVAEESAQDNQQRDAAIAGFYLGYIAGWFVYHWISNATGGGWGKRIVGIRVISLDTNRAPTAGAAFLRALVSVVSGTLYLGYLWALWDPQRRTWHDKASGTTVIYVR